MASTDSNSAATKTDNASSGKGSSSRTAKSGSRSSSTKSGASRSNGGAKNSSGRRGANRRRSTADARSTLLPYLSSTAASLIGAGIAIGISLFATRRQWMPYTEEFNDYLHDRWDNLASGQDYDFDDDDDFDHWPAGEEPGNATFPGDGIRPTA